MPQTRSQSATTPGATSSAMATAGGGGAVSPNPPPTPTVKKTVLTPPPPPPPITPHSQKYIHMKATTPGTPEMAFSKRLAGRVSLETPFRKGMVLQTPIAKRGRESDSREVSPSEMMTRRKKTRFATATPTTATAATAAGTGISGGGGGGVYKQNDNREEKEDLSVPKTPARQVQRNFEVVVFNSHGRGGRAAIAAATSPIHNDRETEKTTTTPTEVGKDEENLEKEEGEEEGNVLTGVLQSILTRLDGLKNDDHDDNGDHDQMRQNILEEFKEGVEGWDVEELPGAMAAIQGSVEMKGSLFKAIFEAIVQEEEEEEEMTFFD
ncbi:hypothetical protein AA313_de0200206 [Arthrobotrys entomopaga]|nr:hypothetical protein AA313_de0200206 [Arthrobotrys entomopaga]